ncbi:MAG TPA: DUF4097 family beta strand repeat-containing protein [Candidatus Rubrimentiphilum sp.]|nr:DUF4097 family beta strand repeat-containing protein [Candidatus Rubrimentiphilum sp.]
MRGDISVYAPERGQPDSMFTISANADVPQGSIVARGRSITVSAPGPDLNYLIRGPKGAVLTLATSRGSINVADFDGVVNASTGTGDIKMLIPQYGNATAGTGNISVIFASTTWPGTLHFSSAKGDVELYVNENAAAHVHLHTDNGTIFTDFPLKGTASGTSETIDSTINGGAKRAIDVEVRDGSIRVLQLKPQV